MADRENAHTLSELQDARHELDRLRRLVIRETAVDVRGKLYYPSWVVKEFGLALPENGEIQ